MTDEDVVHTCVSRVLGPSHGYVTSNIGYVTLATHLIKLGFLMGFLEELGMELHSASVHVGRPSGGAAVLGRARRAQRRDSPLYVACPLRPL